MAGIGMSLIFFGRPNFLGFLVASAVGLGIIPLALRLSETEFLTIFSVAMLSMVFTGLALDASQLQPIIIWAIVAGAFSGTSIAIGIVRLVRFCNGCESNQNQKNRCDIIVQTKVKNTDA